MEGAPNQKPSLDELIAKAKDNMTHNQEAGTNQREKIVELFEGKVPSDEIVNEIKGLGYNTEVTGGGMVRETLQGAIKGHEVVLAVKEGVDYNQGGNEVKEYKGTIDGNELSPEDAQKLFEKYTKLQSELTKLDMYTKGVQEQMIALGERENKTKEAVEDLMHL